MIRNAVFFAIVLGSAATALAAVAPTAHDIDVIGANVSVIQKNEVFPILGPIVVESCAVEDCSDLPG
jgi:hypothetical protein